MKPGSACVATGQILTVSSRAIKMATKWNQWKAGRISMCAVAAAESSSSHRSKFSVRIPNSDGSCSKRGPVKNEGGLREETTSGPIRKYHEVHREEMLRHDFE